MTRSEVFVGPTNGDRVASVSPLERLELAVETHAKAEEDALDGYRRLAADDPDPIVRLVMKLVLDDELRHHDLLERIAARLRDDLEWSDSARSLPPGGPARLPRSREQMAQVLAYVREERDGARQLRGLARSFGPVHDGMIALLLESMALDSEKHERLLRFVLRRLTA